MSKNTFTGKNVDVAIEKAAKATGVAADQLNFEILAGKTGGFALIKVLTGEKKPQVEMVEKLSGDGSDGSSDEPRRESRGRDDRGGDRDRGRGDRGGRGGDRGGRGGDRGGRAGDRGGRGGDRGGRGGDRGGRGGDRGGRGGDRGGDRGGRGRRREEPIEVPVDGPIEVTFGAAEGAELSAIGERAMEVTAEILRGMAFGMHISAEETETSVRLDLSSGVYHDAMIANDMGLLDALEHIIDKIVNQTPDQRKKITVDSQGVKAKADLDLSDSAIHMAARAIEEGRTVKLGPLDPRARRIVHMALREHEGVTTRSEGDGVFRRVCIIPKKAAAEVAESEQE